MKLLPQSVKNPQGFTLIELMVVVVIIAILAVIGASVFGNVQARARDGKRRAEITAIGKSMEASKDPAGTTYKYTNIELAKDFPAGIPVDPTAAMSYCSGFSTTAGTAAAVATTNVASGCPTGGATMGALSTATLTSGTTNTGTSAIVGGTATSFVICASLES